MGLWTRRRLGKGVAAASAVLLGIACAPRSDPPASPPPSAPASPTTGFQPVSSPTPWSPAYNPAGAGATAADVKLSGKLVLAANGNISLFDLATKQPRTITNYPTNTLIASPALSPDRQQIAYTIYTQSTTSSDLGGSDLFVVGVDGSNPHRLGTKRGPNVSFESPCWTTDGTAILATRRVLSFNNGQFVGQTLTVVRVPIEGAPSDFIPSACCPAVAPDGRSLAYDSVDASQIPSDLVFAKANGTKLNSLSADPPFAPLGTIRFASDSARLVFAGAGGPSPGTRRTADEADSSFRSAWELPKLTLQTGRSGRSWRTAAS